MKLLKKQTKPKEKSPKIENEQLSKLEILMMTCPKELREANLKSLEELKKK